MFLLLVVLLGFKNLGPKVPNKNLNPHPFTPAQKSVGDKTVGNSCSARKIFQNLPGTIAMAEQRSAAASLLFMNVNLSRRFPPYINVERELQARGC